MQAEKQTRLVLALTAALCCSLVARAQVIDTGQGTCFDGWQQVSCPAPGSPFAGQDALYAGTQPGYMDNGNGTVTDINTGLMWQQDPDLEHRSTYAAAVAGAAACRLGGHDDWRLPTIKELYSLIDFGGSTNDGTPYLDTRFFSFRFGDPSLGERTIDAQYWSSTEYVGTVFGGRAAVFGVNFADGRIKAYPKVGGGNGRGSRFFVRYVRGPVGYGVNRFVDNGDGTITDHSTGLTWAKADSGAAIDWQRALAYAEGLSLAGHDDWRLPNAKELQSIVDYSRAPDATDPSRRGPAIDPVFELTETESWYWTSTTLQEHPPDHGDGSQAVYLAFGQAFGVFQDRQGKRQLVNVHGAGAQRSDPKSGDPGAWSNGRGPQNDQVRILNYARAVRGGAKARQVTTVTTAATSPNPTWSGQSRYPSRSSQPGRRGNGQGRAGRQGSGSGRSSYDLKAGSGHGRGSGQQQGGQQGSWQQPGGQGGAAQQSGKGMGPGRGKGMGQGKGMSQGKGMGQGQGKGMGQGQGSGQGRRRPPACSSDADCTAANACPPDAGLGCACVTTPMGDRACIPSCRSDADCPTPPGRSLRCETAQGICVP